VPSQVILLLFRLVSSRLYCLLQERLTEMLSGMELTQPEATTEALASASAAASLGSMDELCWRFAVPSVKEIAGDAQLTCVRGTQR
jgi:hypothetical protein